MMSQYLQPVIQWLHVHPEWAGLAVFLVAFAESVAVIGTIIPGSVMMTAVGGLAGLGIIPVWTTLLYAIAGAILGDNLSFYLGTLCKDSINHIWPLTHFPELLRKGRDFFNQHGGKSVFIGRFVGVVRAITPMIAGSMGFPVSRYLPICILSAILWAPLYLFPGFILGAASQSLPPQTALRLISLVCIVLLILWLSVRLIRATYQWCRLHVRFRLGQLSELITTKKNLTWLATLTRDGNTTHHRHQLLAAFIFLLSALLLGLLACGVTHHSVITFIDYPISQLARHFFTPSLQKSAIIISLLGEKKVLAGMFLLSLAWLTLKKEWALAAHWVGFFVLAALVGLGIKHGLHIARPTGLMTTRHGFSFPSGHVTLITVFAGFFAILLGRRTPPGKKHLPYLIALTLILIVAFSRIYLGAHWATDALGGFLVGTTVLALTFFSLQRWSIDNAPVNRLLTVTLASFIPLALVFGLFTFTNKTKAFTPKIEHHALTFNAWWHHPGNRPNLYRTNRLGKLMETLNIESLSRLTTLKATLGAHGWTTLAPVCLSSVLTHTSILKGKLTAPLLKQVVNYQTPVLVLYKVVHTHKRRAYLVLRLWDSFTHVKDVNAPLWVGTLAYRVSHNHRFLTHRQALHDLADLPEPTDVFTHDLGNAWQHNAGIISKRQVGLEHHLVRLLIYPKNLRKPS